MARRYPCRYRTSEEIIPVLKERYVENIRNGLTHKASAKAVGRGPSATWRWMRQDPEFKANVLHAELERAKVVEDVLYQKALGGHLTALIFWLCNRVPDQWRHVQNIRIDADVRQVHVLADLVKLAGKAAPAPGEA